MPGYLFQIEGHCKDANTVYISVQYIYIGNFGKKGKAKGKNEIGRIRIVLYMKILREKKTKKENFIIDVYCKDCQKDAL